MESLDVEIFQIKSERDALVKGYGLDRASAAMAERNGELEIKLQAATALFFKLYELVQDHAEGGNIENYSALDDKLDEVVEAWKAET